MARMQQVWLLVVAMHANGRSHVRSTYKLAVSAPCEKWIGPSEGWMPMESSRAGFVPLSLFYALF